MNILSKVEVMSLSEQGMGVGRVDGKVVFIKNAIPGDIVDVKVFIDKKKFQVGEVANYLEKSKDRVEPPCPNFGACGGCDLMMLSYEDTLKWKSKWIKDTFSKVGRVDITAPVVKATEPFHYRNKVTFHGFLRKEKFHLGFYRKDSHAPILIDTCLIIPEKFLEIKAITEQLCNAYEVYPETVMFRTNGSEIMVHLEVDRKKYPRKKIKVICDDLEIAFDEITYTSFTGHSKGLESEFKMKIDDSEYLVNENAFFQVNTKGSEVLYDLLKELIKDKEIETLYDLYCGVGSIGIYLSSLAKNLVGIDVTSDSIYFAKKNVVLNKVKDAEFLEGRVEYLLEELEENKGLVVLDPPRSGLDKRVADFLVEKGPKHILYIGCGLGKIARDVGLFVEGGYEVDTLEAVDMFPWSGHVECVVLLSQKF